MNKKFQSAIFLIIGIALLFFLVHKLDFNVLKESFDKLGANLFIVFLYAIIWKIFNAFSLKNLLHNRVGFFQIFYTQLVGEAYNQLIPLAGLGGEPFKIKDLARFVPLNDASEAILRDKLANGIAGILLTVLSVIALFFVLPDMKHKLSVILTVVGIVLIVVTVLLFKLSVSDAPGKLLFSLLKKLGVKNPFHATDLDPHVFTVSFLYRFVGRLLGIGEIVLLFYFLGLDITFQNIITVQAFLSLSATVFFIVPGGIGVNEAGISGAFKLLGLNPAIGLSLGLIRRARILFWSLLGVAAHGIHVLYSKMTKK